MHLVWRTNYKSIRSWIKFHKRNASASCIQLKKQDIARTPEAPFLSLSSPCISLPRGNITWSTMALAVGYFSQMKPYAIVLLVIFVQNRAGEILPCHCMTCGPFILIVV